MRVPLRRAAASASTSADGCADRSKRPAAARSGSTPTSCSPPTARAPRCAARWPTRRGSRAARGAARPRLQGAHDPRRSGRRVRARAARAAHLAARRLHADRAAEPGPHFTATLFLPHTGEPTLRDARRRSEVDAFFGRRVRRRGAADADARARLRRATPTGRSARCTAGRGASTAPAAARRRRGARDRAVPRPGHERGVRGLRRARRADRRARLGDWPTVFAAFEARARRTRERSPRWRSRTTSRCATRSATRSSSCARAVVRARAALPRPLHSALLDGDVPPRDTVSSCVPARPRSRRDRRGAAAGVRSVEDILPERMASALARRLDPLD